MTVQESTELGRAIDLAPRQPRLREWRGLRYLSSLRASEALADYRVLAEILPYGDEIRKVTQLIDLRPVAASIGERELMWRYTTESPNNDTDWKTVGFDDTSWEVGGGLFANTNSDVRWGLGDIWLRHEFELEEAVETPLVFLALIDDAAEFYINGVYAGRGSVLPGGRYKDVQRLAGAELARQALRPGKNVLAVHARDGGGLSLLRVGLYTASETDELEEFITRMLAAGADVSTLLEERARLHVERGDWKKAFADQKILRAVEESSAWDAAKVREIVPPASSWRYSDDGRDLGTSWREPEFDDSNWKEHRAPLGFGDPVATVISFGPDGQNKHPTTYFRRTFVVRQPETFSALRVYLRRDDAAAVYINGVEVLRENLPDGASYKVFSTGTVSNQEELRYGRFPVDPSVLRAGTNVVAVEVHQVNATSSDLSFDLVIEGLES